MLLDLDDTVLDFGRAERSALRAAFRRLRLRFRHGTLERYRAINAELWRRYTEGRMAGEQVAVERFRRLLVDLGEDERRAGRLGRVYLEELSRRGDVLPHARAALRQLARRYRLAVVTNGYERVQRARLAAAGLTSRFDAIVTSEGSGYSKPHPGIVEAALAALGASRTEAIFAGDDLRTDCGAAAAAGVRFVWIDHGRRPPGGAPRPRGRARSLAELAARLLA